LTGGEKNHSSGLRALPWEEENKGKALSSQECGCWTEPPKSGAEKIRLLFPEQQKTGDGKKRGEPTYARKKSLQAHPLDKYRAG